VEHVASIIRGLPEIAPEIRISKQKARRVESIELIRQQRDERKQDLLFNSRPFLLCSLPIRRPEEGTLLHERRNGKYFLQVCGHPQFGLPFGQDRLVPIWVATQAVRSRNREIRFGVAAEILHELGLPLDGVHYRRLIDSFQRVFASTIYFGSESPRVCGTAGASTTSTECGFGDHSTRKNPCTTRKTPLSSAKLSTRNFWHILPVGHGAALSAGSISPMFETALCCFGRY